jgi:hypothetical protein
MVPGGQLATLLDVRKSAQFSTDLVPAAAVQWMGKDEKAYSNRTRLATHHFRISLAANSAATSTRVANLDDAMGALMPLIDDGNGNGIEPMFTSPANFGLGISSCQETMIMRTQLSWEVREGAGQIIWAYAFIDYDAVVQVRSS